MVTIVSQHVVQCSFDFALLSPESLAQTPAELSDPYGPSVPPLEKRCKRCDEIKPINQFYSDRSKKDGYRSDCKLCQLESRREWTQRKENARKMGLAEIPSEKECTKCHCLLPLECFRPEKSYGDGRRSYCRDCENARVRATHKRKVRQAEDRSEKQCGRCHRFLPFDCFKQSAYGRLGLASCCKECAAALALSVQQGQKQCATCQCVLPRSEFDQQLRVRDGLYGSCRTCRAASALANRTAEKQCSKCGRRLPVGEFGPDKRTRSGLRSDCLACHRDQSRQDRDPRKKSEEHLRREYGLTLQEYSEMLAQQGGVCAACKMPETCLYGVGHKKGEVQPLSVDHDHETGMVRALLCKKCNTSLGWFGEDPARIQALAEYAEWCQSLKVPQ